MSLLQGMAYTKNIAKIAMTSVDRSGDEEKLLNMGFTDYIVKPFDKKKLQKLLRSASLKRIKVNYLFFRRKDLQIHKKYEST